MSRGDRSIGLAPLALAELLEHGLLWGSFVPPPAIREPWDLTRYRKRLVQAHSSECQRVHSNPRGAGIKLDSVASDVLGMSWRAMLKAADRRRARPPRSSPSWPRDGWAQDPGSGRRCGAASGTTTPLLIHMILMSTGSPGGVTDNVPGTPSTGAGVCPPSRESPSSALLGLPEVCALPAAELLSA